MLSIYTAPGGFRANAAGEGTEQSKTRPITLTGQGETFRYRLTDAAFAEWEAEQDADKRGAILAAGKRSPIKTGKVQIPKSALDAWQDGIRATVDARNAADAAAYSAAVDALDKSEREAFVKANPAPVPMTYSAHAAAVLASGVVVIEAAEEDKTEETLTALFS